MEKSPKIVKRSGTFIGYLGVFTFLKSHLVTKRDEKKKEITTNQLPKFEIL